MISDKHIEYIKNNVQHGIMIGNGSKDSTVITVAEMAAEIERLREKSHERAQVAIDALNKLTHLEVHVDSHELHPAGTRAELEAVRNALLENATYDPNLPMDDNVRGAIIDLQDECGAVMAERAELQSDYNEAMATIGKLYAMIETLSDLVNDISGWESGEAKAARDVTECADELIGVPPAGDVSAPPDAGLAPLSASVTDAKVIGVLCEAIARLDRGDMLGDVVGYLQAASADWADGKYSFFEANSALERGDRWGYRNALNAMLERAESAAQVTPSDFS